MKLCLATASTASQPVPVVAERALTHAFPRFTEAAESFSGSYHQLELEVRRPRQELEERTTELARSREENRRIKDSMTLIMLGYSSYLLFWFAGHFSKPSAESGL